MKHLCLATCMLLTLAACNSEPRTPAVDANTSEAIVSPEPVVTEHIYTVDPANSTIYWIGDKVVGDMHEGTMLIREGKIGVNNNAIVNGDFDIDMTSINVTDLDGDGKAKLERHLMNEDFFEVEKHPSAIFEIVRVEPVAGREEYNHNLTGNLTLRGVTKSVTVPAKVTVTDETIMATTPQFEIDRTDWGIEYGSGLAGAVGNRVINDEIKLKIDLLANRAAR